MRRTRSSSSACRARARRCSSRSCPRHSQVEGTTELPEIITMAKDLRAEADSADIAVYAEVLASQERRRAQGDGGALPRAHTHPSQDGSPVLHRQDAEQLPARRHDPRGAAERKDHRRSPASAGLLFLELQAVLRARPELQLLAHRHGSLLSRLRRAHGALRRGAAGARPSRHLRAHGRGHRSGGAQAARPTAACRSSRAACASSRTSAPCARRAPSRSAARSTGTASSNGGTTSPGSVRSRKRWVRCWRRIRRCRVVRTRPLRRSRAAPRCCCPATVQSFYLAFCRISL